MNHNRAIHPQPRRSRANSRRLRPAVTALEDRTLLSWFMVSNTNDSGDGSLRQAILDANTNAGVDDVLFSDLFNSPQTITLTGGQIMLTDTAPTTIAGPGVNLLTVSGGGKGRVFNVQGGSAALVSMSITGGSDDRGGGLLNSGGAVLLANCIISGNSASSGGGGLYSTGGLITLTGCTVSGNSAHDGGGLLNKSGSAALTDCTVSGNTTVNNGAGVFNYTGGTTTLTNCTISKNTAQSAKSNGGGVFNHNGTVTMTNCTISVNHAYLSGGGVFNNSTATLINCAISNNSSGAGGGGLYNLATATLINTIVNGNSVDGLFLGGASHTTLSHSLVFANGRMDFNGGWIDAGGNVFGADPRMTDLGDYGGPTFTKALLPDSPAIGAGTTAGALATDQRGLPRTDHVDIGPFQSQGFTFAIVPGGTPQTAMVGQPFQNPLAVALTANNPREPVNGVGVVYTVTPSAGGASASFNGTSYIANGRAAVRATANALTGSYTVTATIAKQGTLSFALTNISLMVTTTEDDVAFDGVNSLREAIAYASTLPGPNTITFDPAVFGKTPQTITLTTGQLALTDSATTTIIGPGAGLLTVSGNRAGRVFEIQGGSAALSGLTITGGSTGIGGGLSNNGGTTTLTNCAISGNVATDFGGGLYTHQGGETTLTGCTVSGNSAAVGGGLFNKAVTVTLTNCTVSGNSAQAGGGLSSFSGFTTLTNCTVSGNSANNGAALYINSGSPTLTNTIVAGNVGNIGIVGSLAPASSHNLIGGDPRLAPLGDYGGPTWTMPLLPGSPAIGAGATGPGIPTIDQRGFNRGSTVDIGAFQTQAAALAVNTTAGGNGADAGKLSLRQAINLAKILPGAETITFDPAVFGKTPQTITLTTGQLALTDTATTTIIGPGARLLTVSGNRAGRVFEIQGGSAALSGLTITGGSSDRGGGLSNNGGTLHLTDCIVSGNSATEDGGGLYNVGGSITLTGCTISGNSAVYGGGGLFSDGVTTLTNCTVSGNTAGGDGGGLFLQFDGVITLINCTVSGNSVGWWGSGLSIGGWNTLINTIVAGNFGSADNIIGTPGPESSNNLIDGDPRLAPLGDYGGPTQTMPLLPGSPAIGAGTTGPGIPTTDQRGLPRTGHVDIGAFQSQVLTITPVSGSTPQSAVGGSAFANPLVVVVTDAQGNPLPGVTVTFAAPNSGASATLTRSPVVTGADGRASVTATANTTTGSYTVTASAAGVATAATFTLTNTDTVGSLNLVTRHVTAVAGRPFTNLVLATFTDPAPGASPSGFVAAIAWGDGITTDSTTVTGDGQGGFQVLGTHTYDNPGTYTFSVQVTAGDGTTATATGTATVAAAARPLMLTTHRDVVDEFDGLTSLREAIDHANRHPGPDTITFDPAVFGKAPRTIKLIGGPLVLTDTATTTIIGPGAKLLTFLGDGKSGVFEVRGSAAISGLTIRGGSARGGGLLNDGTAALTDVVLRGNRALVGGGLANFGTMSLTRVVLRGNRALVGGGLFNAGKATLTDVVIRGNRTRLGSGLFSTRRATLTWRRSAAGEQG